MSKKLEQKGSIDFSDLDAQSPPSTTPIVVEPHIQASSTHSPQLARPRSGVAAINRSIGIQQELQEARERLKTFDDALIVVKLDPKLIRDSPWRNRDLRSFDTEAFRQLKAEVLAAGGNVQPVKVRPIGLNQYEIVYGRRRTRACLELGLEVNAVIDSELSDFQAFVDMYRENMSREDLTPWEQGMMYADALQKGVFPSLRKLAEGLGVNLGNASVAIQLAQLPAEVISAFKSPLDLQFRWAKPLKEAIDRDPSRVLQVATEIVALEPRPNAKEIFERLTGQTTPAKNQSREIKVGRKVVGAIVRDEKGGVTLRINAGAISIEQEKRLLQFFSELLS